jgi:hypothetical protein
VREQIKKKLMMETSYFKHEDNISKYFPCPQRPHLRCEYAKMDTIFNGLIGVYCDNKECDIFNLNCNEAIIIDTIVKGEI